ncbi:MAG: outer membrane beta-barrel protein [Cyclobacteriaceae bacterium]
MNRVVLIISIWLIASGVFAQDCERNLQDARRAYLNGNFNQVVTLLQSCPAQLTNSDDQKNAYELLINAHLITEELRIADSLMNALLTKFPLYTTRSTDLFEFQQLYESYQIFRQWSINAFVGFNHANFQVMQQRSYGSISDSPITYKTSLRPVLGLDANYYFTPHLYASAGLIFQQSAYTQRESLLRFQYLDISERLTYINMPLQIGNAFERGKFTFLIQTGMSMHFLASSKADLALFGRDPDFTTTLTGLTRTVTDRKLTEQRRGITWNYTIGAGIRRNIGLTSVSLTAQYEYGLRNLAKASRRYQDEELLIQYSYVADDFKMNNLQFRIGLSRHFVKPQKKL